MRSTERRYEPLAIVERRDLEQLDDQRGRFHRSRFGQRDGDGHALCGRCCARQREQCAARCFVLAQRERADRGLGDGLQWIVRELEQQRHHGAGERLAESRGRARAQLDRLAFFAVARDARERGAIAFTGAREPGERDAARLWAAGPFDEGEQA